MSQRLERCRIRRRDAARETPDVRRSFGGVLPLGSRVSSAYAYGFIVVYAITCASRFTPGCRARPSCNQALLSANFNVSMEKLLVEFDRTVCRTIFKTSMHFRIGRPAWCCMR